MVIVINRNADKKAIEEALGKLQDRKGFDAKKHCGVLKLEEDALEIQRRLRDEWE
ncbi:MAG TPA: hypothetical protein VEC12_08870 [Bacteroidia bacterium]|nr:hypothetical protein [Bacteroidia bacterium]